MEQQISPGQAAVQAAIARRQGTPTPQLGQTSSDAPMQVPSMPMPANADMNKSSAPQIQPKQKWEPQTQADFALSAIVEQLKNTNKLEMEKMKMSQQPPVSQPSMGAMPVAQSQPPMPQGDPMGAMPAGGGGPDMFSTPKDGSTGYFDMSVPSMFSPMSTNQKQNQYGM